MYVKEDYGYIGDTENLLIERGFGEMSIHSIHFDRHYTDEQKKANRQLAESMTPEMWSLDCEEISKELEKSMKEILSKFIGKFDIHQVSEETSTISHYRSDWDLYFYSSALYIGKTYMDCFSLTFNDSRTIEQNRELLKEVISIVEPLDIDNVGCRVQYRAVFDENKLNEKAAAICESFLNKTIAYRGMTGKIKIVEVSEDGKIEYGFFKLRAKRKYYKISAKELVALYSLNERYH